MAQTWNAGEYAREGRFVADLAGDVLGWLAPRPGERILDLGCGDGALTERIRAAGAVVVGVDSSPEMVAAARARGLDARLMSGDGLTFSGEFDAVFSNAALHWMLDQQAVLRGVQRALVPGGRFVAEMGGHGNIAAIRTALRAVCARFAIDGEGAGANVFFTAEEYAELLRGCGFRVERIELVPRPTPLPGGMDRWLRTFRRGLLAEAGPELSEQIVTETVALLAPILRDRTGHWIADYVRLRFIARN